MGLSSSKSAKSFSNVAASYCRWTTIDLTFFVTDRLSSSSPDISYSPKTATRDARNLEIV